jgi:hypothetical protein
VGTAHAGMTSAGSGAPSKSGGAVCLDASKSARLGLGCRQPPLRSPLARGDGNLLSPNTIKEVIVTSQPRSIWRMSGQGHWIVCGAAAKRIEDRPCLVGLRRSPASPYIRSARIRAWTHIPHARGSRDVEADGTHLFDGNQMY